MPRKYRSHLAELNKKAVKERERVRNYRENNKERINKAEKERAANFSPEKRKRLAEKSRAEYSSAKTGRSIITRETLAHENWRIMTKPTDEENLFVHRSSLIGRLRQMYRSMKARNKERGHGPIRISFERFVAWAYENGYQGLHKTWAESKHDKNASPSVDRLEDTRGYTFTNMRLVTWKANNNAANSASSRTCYAFKMGETTPFKQFNSLQEAAEWCGKPATYGTAIGSVCLGKTASAFGYRWSYTETIKPFIVKRVDKVGVYRFPVDSDDHDAYYESCNQAGKSLGKPNGSSIVQYLKGKGNTAYGYRWAKTPVYTSPA